MKQALWIIIFWVLISTLLFLHFEGRQEWQEREARTRHEQLEKALEQKRKRTENLLERLREQQGWQWVSLVKKGDSYCGRFCRYHGQISDPAKCELICYVGIDGKLCIACGTCKRKFAHDEKNLRACNLMIRG